MNLSAMDESEILAQACSHLDLGDKASAANFIRTKLPFERIEKASRTFTANVATRIFIRDGFVDRFSGQRLIFPGALRLLSLLLPTEIPYHENWKLSETHPAFWTLCATIDHLVPVTRAALIQMKIW